MLALIAMLVLTAVHMVSSVEKIMQVFPYYEAPLAAAATAVFATCGLLMGGIAALGAALLARDLRARSSRGRGPLVRGAVTAGLLVVCCLALLVAAAALGGAGASEEIEALHQALLAHWDVALYGLVPSVVALVALCFGAGRLKRSS